MSGCGRWLRGLAALAGLALALAPGARAATAAAEPSIQFSPSRQDRKEGILKQLMAP